MNVSRLVILPENFKKKAVYPWKLRIWHKETRKTWGVFKIEHRRYRLW